jgi:large subunit ribosomal protein L28
MSKCCELLGTKPLVGHNVSHSHIKTVKRSNPNLQKKRYVLHELGRTVTVTVSTRAIRTIDKHGGLGPALLAAKPDLLSPKLTRLRNQCKQARG